MRGKEFTSAVVFKPLADEVKGLHSLNEYQNKEQEHSKLDQLRQLGLTNDEIKYGIFYNYFRHNARLVQTVNI